MRLIDADVAMNWIKQNEAFIDRYILKAIPTIDAVPVVRCRECKQGEVDDLDFPDQYYCRAGCGWNNGDFYCAYGEPKEGADNGEA